MPEVNKAGLCYQEEISGQFICNTNRISKLNINNIILLLSLYKTFIMASIKKAPKTADTQKSKYVEIEKQLATVFESIKKDLGDKKFNQRIKKAVKVITHGLNKKKAGKVKVAKVKKTTIKTSKPAPAATKEKKAVKVKKAAKK
jgi:hypothetical protein